ncbi:MAG: hypothetical protein VX834_06795, partial [Myxococcota bacterium]|nr:hypothetical protein [Myxococcota bacterium]
MRRRTRLISIWLLLGLWACGDASTGAGGCACADEYEYPRNEVAAVPTEGAARLRLTETGLDAVAKMVPGFIREGCAESDGDPSATCEVHPDDPQRMRLYMGEPCNPLRSSTNLLLTTIDAEVRSGPCNGVDYHRSSLDLYLDSFEGNVNMRMFEDSDGEAIELIIGCDEANMDDCLSDGSQYAKGSLNMVWLLAGFWTENACLIRDNPGAEAGLIVQKMRIVLRPKIELGDDLRPYLRFEAADTTIDDLNLSFAIGQDGAIGDPACGSDGCGAWCTVTDWVTSVVEVLLETEFIASVIADAVVDGVIGELTKDPLELSGELDLATLLPVGNERAAPTGFLVTGNTESPTITGNSGNVGMNFDFDAGFFANYVPCAPELAAPSWVLPMPPPPGAVIQAPDPVTGDLRWEAFDLMLMVGDVLIERAAYNLFRGGSLCLNLGAEDLSDLSGGAFVPTVSLFSLIAPGLANLAEADAPVMLQLTPNLPLMVEFGTGEEEGENVDSHIRVLWPEVELSLYPLLDDAYQRALAFNFTLHVGVSLVPTPMGNLRVMIDQLALDDVHESYNELGMPFDPSTVADLIG